MENSIEEAVKTMEHWIEYEKSNKDKINKADELINIQETILSDYKRVLKENEELREKENKIYKEVQENLAFEKFLIVKERKPDLFNQGRFYISQIIYDILNDVQNPEGIHKENKCIQYIDYIPVQKVKDKIEEYKNMCISSVDGYENYFKDNYNELVFRRMEQLEKELLESEE